MAPSGHKASAVVKDIWQILSEQQSGEENALKEKLDPNADAEVLFVGSKQSGKSTLIMNFLMKDDTPKPTTALEYRFARRSTGHSSVTVANIWELGGGTQLSELLKVVLLPEKIGSSVVVIVLDLSVPHEVVPTLQFWLQKVREQVDACWADLQKTEPGAALVNALRQRVEAQWADSPDKDMVRSMGIPVVIMAQKWDVFEAQAEGEQRKIMARTLRFIAHTNGASLMYSRHKDKTMMTLFRNLLYHHVFHTNPVKNVCTEHTKPLIVPAGLDSMAGIGSAPVTAASQGMQGFDVWKEAFENIFPPQATKKDQQELALVESEGFADEAIDSLRKQKREELERQRKSTEQKVKLQEAGAIGVI